MSFLFSLIAHLLVTLARLAKPGGLGAVVAESLAVKHQLLILKRARRRAPYLTSWDRLALGVCTLLVSPKRLSKMAVILKPSTLLYFHRALVMRKYRLLYSPRNRRRPGPKGPSRELIDTVVEMKRRNPRFGCRKIAEQISSAFGIEINKDIVRRIPEPRRLNAAAQLLLQSQTFSHIAGGNTATPYFRPQLPHELEFATDRTNGSPAWVARALRNPSNSFFQAAACTLAVLVSTPSRSNRTAS